jgi:hypothetical protein
VLLRLAYLGVTNVFALLRLLPMSSRDKDAEILALRHQLLVLQRQIGPDRVRFTPADRALLASLLHHLPRDSSACTWWYARIQAAGAPPGRPAGSRAEADLPNSSHKNK